MTNIFITIATMKTLRRGEKLSPDSTFIERGHYPLIDNKPTYNTDIQTISSELVIDEDNKVVNNIYTLADISAEDLRISLKKQVARKSKEIEVGGITFNEMEVSTDRESQALLNGAYAHAGRNPNQEFSFPGKSGWAKVNKAGIDAINDAVGNHIRTTFDIEMAHNTAIDEADLETLKVYDVDTLWT